MAPDLDDLFFFAHVVQHGGFAPAGRALQVPKSKLSRRVAQLEARLGVRLLERSTRRFRVTEVGQVFYERCRTILIDIEQAEAIAAEARSEPRGLIRFSCPTGLVERVAPLMPELLRRLPRVRVQLVATDRAVHLIDERIDLALRVRTALDGDAELSIRTLTKSTRVLVAAPALAQQLALGNDIEALPHAPTLSSADDANEARWTLVGPREQTRVIAHFPRFSCADMGAVRDLACAGLGIALLPDHTCNAALKAGTLQRVLPDWHGIEGTMHLVFTTRRGLPPAVRALIEHLVLHFREQPRS